MCEKCKKKDNSGVNGPHTQVKCLFKLGLCVHFKDLKVT